MIDVQKQVWDMVKIAEEINTTIMEVEGTILQASNNYQSQNIASIFSISEDLQNMVKSDIKNQAYQVQRMLADELDSCRRRENTYVDKNIKEIQELYKKEEREQKKMKRKEVQNNEEVFLYKLYKKLTRPKTPELTFIQDEINNLEKYMKFVQSPTNTIMFTLLPNYKSL